MRVNIPIPGVHMVLNALSAAAVGEELGLTPHQAQMLGFLYSNPELDTASALSARLHVSKGSLSLMLSKLEAGGFVQK